LAATLGALDRGTEPSPAGADADVDFRAHAAWQAEQLVGPRADALRAYWRERLAAAPNPVVLPGPEGMGGASPPDTTRAGRFELALGVALTAELRRFAAARGVTSFSVLLTGLAVALRRYTGESEMIIGAPASGRVHLWQRRLVGYFSNVLPLRIDLSADPTAGQAVERTMATLAGALDHQELPFAEIVRAAHSGQQGEEHPLVRVLFSHQQLGQGMPPGFPALAINVGGAQVHLGDTRFRTVAAPTPPPPFPISCAVAELQGDLTAVVEVDRRFHDDTLARSLAETWATAVAALVRAPDLRLSRTEVLGATDRQALAQLAKRPQADFPPVSIDWAVH